jgi:hypothetical protein
MSTFTKTVTISAGQSLSDAAEIGSTGAVGLLIAPPDWSSANISFQVSGDNAYFGDLFDANGVEVIKAIRPGSAVVVDQSLTLAAYSIKIRSGPREYPVVQAADRTFTLVVV